MSAVPLPAAVLAGTSCLPSSVAFILSAKAGPANATAAPIASEASMVLLRIGFSLLTSNNDVSLKTAAFCFYSPNGAFGPKFPAGINRDYSHNSLSLVIPDDGSVNAATHLLFGPGARICGARDILVADHPGGRRGERASFLPAQSGQRPRHVQCRRMFFLPCRAQSARSYEARRRARAAFAVRHVLRPEHLARSE